MLGKTREAMDRYKELIELHPDLAALHYWKSQVHAWLTEYEAAIDEAKQSVKLDNASLLRVNLAWVYAVAGKKQEAKAILDDVLIKADIEYTSPVWIGLAEIAMGRTDEGYRWIEKGIEAKDTNLLYLTNLPWLKPYTSDPRWKKIDEKLLPMLGPR